MTILRTFLAATLATLVANATAHAQDAAVIRPGSREVNGSRVAARTDTFAVSGLLEGREVPMGSLELRTTLVTAAGAPAVSRVERMTLLGGMEVSVDSFTLAAATLAPLAYADRAGTDEASFVFDGLTVRGTRSEEGKREPVAVRLAAPVFLGNSMDVILSALPLAEGRAFRWERLREYDVRVDSVEVRVAGRETVRTVSGGSCGAWRVEVRSDGGTSVYWVEKETGELLRYEDEDQRFLILRHRACPAGDDAVRA